MADQAHNTRRGVLKALSLFGVAAAPAIASSLPVAAKPVAQMRMAHHLAEFQRAAEEADSSIYAWRAHTDPTERTCITITASRRRCEYQGDGWYISDPSQGVTDRVWVQYEPQYDRNGERWFSLTDDAEAPNARLSLGKPVRRYTEEPFFDQFVVAKAPV